MKPAYRRAAGGHRVRVTAIVGALTAARRPGLRYSAVDRYFDESQYRAWARRLDFGCFSKPPPIAWLIAAGYPALPGAIFTSAYSADAIWRRTRRSLHATTARERRSANGAPISPPFPIICAPKISP